MSEKRPANGMVFRVVDIEAMGTVKEWGEPLWPWLQEALSKALTVGAIEPVKPESHPAHGAGQWEGQNWCDKCNTDMLCQLFPSELPEPNPDKLYRIVKIKQGERYSLNNTYMVDFEDNIAIVEVNGPDIQNSRENPEPYLEQTTVRYIWNKDFPEDALCDCGHTYYRHFDTGDSMHPVGCKYCSCYKWTRICK